MLFRSVSSPVTNPNLIFSGRLQAIEDSVYEIKKNVCELTRLYKLDFPLAEHSNNNNSHHQHAKSTHHNKNSSSNSESQGLDNDNLYQQVLKEQTAVSTKGMTQGDRLKVLKSMGQIHQNNNQNLAKSSQRSKNTENASTNHRENSKTVNYSSSGNNPNFNNEEDMTSDKRPVRSTRRNHTAHTIKAVSGYGTDTSKQSYKNWFGVFREQN